MHSALVEARKNRARRRNMGDLVILARWGPPLLAFFIAVELLAPPAILQWHRKLFEA